MNDFIDAKGLMYCGRHRREVCHICCVDHRFCNEIVLADEDPDMDALNDKHDRLQAVEHAAIAQQHAAEGGQGPIMLGTEESQRLFDAAASRPAQRICAQCSMRGDKLQRCSKCQEAYYCSVDCQKAHWPAHKKACKAAAKAAAKAQASGSSIPSSSNRRLKELVSWKQLEELQGATADGRVLELRVMTQPEPNGRYRFEGKDHKNDIQRVVFYCERPPRGLALGKIMRWHNPHFFWFADGSKGAKIEEEALLEITIE